MNLPRSTLLVSALALVALPLRRPHERRDHAAKLASLVSGDGPSLRHPVGAPLATGTILGTVVVEGSDIHLSYSVVSIAALNREQFTDSAGRFTLRDVPTGSLILRVKHIGYNPVDLPVSVKANDTTRVVVGLARIAVALPAVKSVGTCTKPGPPDPRNENNLYTLFEQMKQNAERSRLLTRSYPFKYSVSRMSALQPANATSPPDTQSVDTLQAISQRDWRYSPGRMVVMENDGERFGERLVIPQLADFADDEFIKNHCFGYAGIEEVDGVSMARIDFAPADKIKDPDIEGTVYLDSATLQIRRADITLTKPSRALLRSLAAVTIATVYEEVAPGIPIMARYSSVTTFPKEQAGAGWSATLVSQRIISVEWLKGKP